MDKIKYSHNELAGRYYDAQRINTDKLEKLLKSGSVDMCTEVLEEFFEEIGFFKIQSFLMRLYVAMDIYILVRTFSKDLGIPNEKFVKQYGSIDDIERSIREPEVAVGFFSEMLGQCIRWRVEYSHEMGNDTIRKAIEYIDENYVRDDMSLKNAAEAVNLTPTYFSTLFKKETGTNFSDYLSKLRVEKAKELLCRTSKLVCEIAQEVGFSDYRYFGQIFKRHTGQTPREFQTNSNRV